LPVPPAALPVNILPPRWNFSLRSNSSFYPQLKTHKLKGKLAGSWACSAGYDLRVVFQFVKHKGADAILLEGIGTHDEVYWMKSIYATQRGCEKEHE
jgi:hypothetical protein